MSIMPMWKCKKCKKVFSMPSNGIRLTCPRCGSHSIKSASPIDLIFQDNPILKK